MRFALIFIVVALCVAVPLEVAQLGPTILADYAACGYRPLIVGVAGALIVLFYYLLVWRLRGNDPPKHTIVPTWEPPDGLSPAAVRCLLKMRCDNKAVTAAIISAAVKGYVKIEQDEDGTYTLTRTRGRSADLSEDELLLLKYLLNSGGRLRLERGSYAGMQFAVNEFRRHLEDSFSGRYYNTNSRLVRLGLGLSIGTLAVTLLIGAGPIAIVALLCMLVWLALWAVAAKTAVRDMMWFWRIRRGKGILDAVDRALMRPALTAAAYAAAYVLGWVMMLILFLACAGPRFVIPLLLLTAINLVFRHLMKCYTTHGIDLFSQVLGFRMYLSVAESAEIRQAGGPVKTLELYEKLLPYAVALDVENQWAEKFSQVLSNAVHVGGYEPVWY